MEVARHKFYVSFGRHDRPAPDRPSRLDTKVTLLDGATYADVPRSNGPDDFRSAPAMRA
jgi:hypothetical protein